MVNPMLLQIVREFDFDWKSKILRIYVVEIQLKYFNSILSEVIFSLAKNV